MLHLFQQYFTPHKPPPKQGESEATLSPDLSSRCIIHSTIPFCKCFKSCSPMSDQYTKATAAVMTCKKYCELVSLHYNYSHMQKMCITSRKCVIPIVCVKIGKGYVVKHNYVKVYLMAILDNMTPIKRKRNTPLHNTSGPEPSNLTLATSTTMPLVRAYHHI